MGRSSDRKISLRGESATDHDLGLVDVCVDYGGEPAAGQLSHRSSIETEGRHCARPAVAFRFHRS